MMAGLRGYLFYLYGSICQLQSNIVRTAALRFSGINLSQQIMTQRDSETDITPVILIKEYVM